MSKSPKSGWKTSQNLMQYGSFHSRTSEDFSVKASEYVPRNHKLVSSTIEPFNLRASPTKPQVI